MNKHLFGAISVLLLLAVLDVSAQRVRPTDSMSIKRVFHELQPLPDGKVLVFGGQTTGNLFMPVVHASAEIFDPSTEQWSAATSMNAKRRNFASVVLADGKILAIGGSDSTDTELSSTEIYDPQTGTWAPAGSLNKARQNIDAIRMANGTIIVMGFDHVSFESSTDNGASWNLHEFQSLGYRFPEAPKLVNLPDGRVLAVGLLAGPYPNWATLISTNLAIDTADNPIIDDHPNAGTTVLSNGKVLISGGTASGVCELFDPAANTFTATGSFNSSHGDCELMPMGDGRVAAFEVGSTFRDAILEIYNSTTGQWTYQTGHSFTGTTAYQTLPIGNGKHLVCGGGQYLEPITAGSRKCFIFDENDIGSGTGPEEAPLSCRYFQSGPHEIQLHILGLNSSTPSQASLYDISGRLLRQYSLMGENAVLNLPGLSPGMYLLRVTSSNAIQVGGGKIILH